MAFWTLSVDCYPEKFRTFDVSVLGLKEGELITSVTKKISPIGLGLDLLTNEADPCFHTLNKGQKPNYPNSM
jgi:hypothetical protein